MRIGSSDVFANFHIRKIINAMLLEQKQFLPWAFYTTIQNSKLHISDVCENCPEMRRTFPTMTSLGS